MKTNSFDWFGQCGEEVGWTLVVFSSHQEGYVSCGGGGGGGGKLELFQSGFDLLEAPDRIASRSKPSMSELFVPKPGPVVKVGISVAAFSAKQSLSDAVGMTIPRFSRNKTVYPCRYPRKPCETW